MPAEIGSVADFVRPSRRNRAWMRARPTRPLPSANGWMFSNWACITIAWMNTGMSVRDMNSHRSSIASGIRRAAGGT